MLQNRLYRGEIVHKDQAYPGEHAPIIDADLWQEVQKTLAANRVDRGAGKGNHHLSLLAGLIYDAHGELMTPSHAVKKGVRYRYYVSKNLVTGGVKAERTGQRIPASHIEALVTGRIRAWLADPVVVLNAIQCCGSNAVAQKRLLDEAARLAATWQDLDAEQLRAILRAMVTRVQVHSDRVDVTLDQMGVALWLNAKDQPRPIRTGGNDRERYLTVLTIPARLKRTGIEMRMVVEDGSEPANVDSVLVRLLLRAHAIRARLLDEPSLPLKEIAAEEGVSSSYVTRLSKARLPRPRHCHGDLEWKASSTAHRQSADGRYPLASRLDRTARTPLLLNRINSRRLRASRFSVSLSCQELRPRPRDSGTANARHKRRGPQRRSIGAPEKSLATAPDEVRVQGSENTRQFAPQPSQKTSAIIKGLIAGGEGGIRTHGTVTRTTVFECAIGQRS